jgi:hypothetical protein
VTFGVTGSNGTLSAKVDDAAVSSPASVVAGKNVVFTAVPASGYRVKEWKSDGEVVVGNTGNEYTLVNVSAAITVTVEFEEIPDVDGKNGFHEEDEDLWYYYIDGVKQYTEGGFFTAEDALRYFRVGGALGFGFEPLADGKWTYILDAGIPAEPGFYDTGDGYWRAIGENGYMLEAGLYSFDGLWRYILNGAIVAPVDWYDDLAGERRYVANGGILLSPGWHFIDGADRYILDGSIPAVGEMEIDGVTYIFDEYGKPIN